MKENISPGIGKLERLKLHNFKLFVEINKNMESKEFTGVSQKQVQQCFILFQDKKPELYLSRPQGDETEFASCCGRFI